AQGSNYYQTIIELARAEALLINRRMPSLCKQRENKIKLALPWTQVLDRPQQQTLTDQEEPQTTPETAPKEPQSPTDQSTPETAPEEPQSPTDETPAADGNRKRPLSHKPKPKRRRLTPDARQRL
ncbi:hypothetical protein Ciccas_012077, partial [Cichlidogyrus casuarinus]